MLSLPWFEGDLTIVFAYVFGILLIYLVGRMLLMPLRLVFRLIYNGLIGGVLLWLLNLAGSHIGFTIAINPVTALIAGFLGLPGVVLLVLFKLFIT